MNQARCSLLGQLVPSSNSAEIAEREVLIVGRGAKTRRAIKVFELGVVALSGEDDKPQLARQVVGPGGDQAEVDESGNAV